MNENLTDKEKIERLLKRIEKEKQAKEEWHNEYSLVRAKYQELSEDFDKKLEIQLALKTKDIYNNYMEFVNALTKLLEIKR